MLSIGPGVSAREFSRAVAGAALATLLTGGVALAEACVADPVAVTARPAAPSGLPPLPAEQAAALAAAVRTAFPEAAAPGIIAGVMTPEGIWTGAWCEADPDSGAPMEVGMHTRIGSVTKTFTGTVLLQLAEDGALSLDDPIGRYVEGLPNGDSITLRQLATMTSGLLSYTRADAFLDRFFEDPTLTYTPAELVEFAVPGSPIFAPGAEFD
jgi:D-alanyl-D-alanine carboxypeptidase